MQESVNRILIIDEDAASCELMRQQLLQLDYAEVVTANDGKEALALLGKTQIDAVLLVLGLQHDDSLAILSALHNATQLRHIPVIVIASHEDNDVVVKCIRLGAEDFLTRPYPLSLLQARLQVSLSKKILRDQERRELLLLSREKRRAETLLSVLLPEPIAHELKTTGKVVPRHHDRVAILFCDIVDFSGYCERHPAEKVVHQLGLVFTAFETLGNFHGLEKIKTIGDAFMAAGGLNTTVENPLLSAVKCGLDMIEITPSIVPSWQVRVGIHMGSVTAGVIGDEKYQFDLWGDTVNMAARMSTTAAANTVTLTQDCWQRIANEYPASPLGTRDIKGKGRMELMEISAARPG
jgi:adenylate cyclase